MRRLEDEEASAGNAAAPHEVRFQATRLQLLVDWLKEWAFSDIRDARMLLSLFRAAVIELFKPDAQLKNAGIHVGDGLFDFFSCLPQGVVDLAASELANPT